MTAFLLLAAVLAAGATAVVIVPLLRERADLKRAHWAALSAGALIVLGSVGLYGAFSDDSWRSSPQSTPQPLVAQLARRLERNPDDLGGWLQLGHSYTVLGQLPLARRAYQRADRLAGGQSAEALTGWAETLALENADELDDRARRLVEQALLVDPDYGKALYYGALTALRNNELPVARQRFARLLELGPPADIQPILKKYLAALDARIAAPASSGAPTASGPVVRVNVSLATSLGTKISPSTPLFVVVRKPGGGGPPLAVKRLTARFPQHVELTSNDSMLEGRTFEAGQEVEVLARIAASGSPTGAQGDPYGSSRYRVGQDGVLNLIIDRLTP